jgi:hypothetical protein
MIKDLISIQFFVVHCICIILFNSHIYSQDERKPYYVNDRIGDTLDIGERNYYNLFPSLQNFRYACFFRNGDNLDAKVNFIQNDIIKDTMFIKYTNVDALNEHVKQMMILNGERDSKSAFRRMRIYLKDGILIFGTIIKKSADSLYIISDAKAGISIPLKEISRIKEDDWNDKDENDKHPENMKITDPNMSRTFLLPTATTPEAMHGYAGDFDLLFLTGIFGITDKIMVNAGVFFLPLLWDVAVFDYGLKINLYDDHKLFSAGIGGQMLRLPEPDKDPGLGYGVVTLGNSENKFNLLVGKIFNVVNSSNSEYSALVGISGQLHLTHQIQFMTEVYFFSGLSYTPLIAGFRFYDKNYSIDLGVLIMLENNTKIPSGLPTLSVFYCF